MGGGDDDPIATRTRSRNRLRLLPFLPEEIIVEILLRLPVRSLLQFKCVCKTWKTLISDPQFAKSHNLSSTPYLQLISVVPGLANCRLLSYPLEPLLEIPSTCVKPVILHSRYNNNTRILGSCNGLLCLHDFPQSEFRLLNPSINFQSKTSPTIVCFDHKFIIYRGFGYDQVNDRYKVLVVVQNEYNHDETKTIIYTFGENSWTTVQNFPFDWRRHRDSHMWLGKFVSGTLNWIVNNNKDGVNSNSANQHVIISFDLEKETYGEVLLPQYDGNNVRNPVLYVSSDCICVCFDHSKEKSWVVWMMKEYGVVESWTKLMIIPQKKLISEDIPSRPLFKALLMSENGVFLLITKYSKLFLYSFNNGRLDYRRNFVNFVCDLHIYQESLISPQW